MPTVEIPCAPQQTAPEIDPRLQRYLGRNQHQHQPVQEPENTQHNLCCRGNFLFSENAHRRKQDRRQQHNFIRQPAIRSGQYGNNHHRQPVIAPRPVPHVLYAEPHTPNETQQQRNELCPEKLPEEYQP